MTIYAHDPRKSCPDFHTSCHDLWFLHSTNWLLSTKSCHDFFPSWHDFCRVKTSKTWTKSCQDLTRPCHGFWRSFNINFE